MNKVKKEFNTLMFNNDQDKYYQWIEANDLETILKEFQEKCALKPKAKKEYEKK